MILGNYYGIFHTWYFRRYYHRCNSSLRCRYWEKLTMLYLTIASEIINGFRKLEDLPYEMRPTVNKAIDDLKTREINGVNQKKE